jgi:hypothetical protein
MPSVFGPRKCVLVRRSPSADPDIDAIFGWTAPMSAWIANFR